MIASCLGIRSRSRAAVNLSLLLALTLAAFLLGGVTTPGLAMRSLYILKLHYVPPAGVSGDNGNDNTFTDATTTTSSRRSGATRSPTIISTTNPTTTGRAKQPIRIFPTAVSPNFQTKSPLVERDNNAYEQKEGVEEVSTIIVPLGPQITPAPQVGKRHQHHNFYPRQVEDDATTTIRSVPTPPPIEDLSTIDDLISLTNVNLDVYFGYYGFCITAPRKGLRCVNSRPKDSIQLRTTLFPTDGMDDSGNSINSTITFREDPQDLVGLGIALQGAMTPVPLIGSIIALGVALAVSLYISCARPMDFTRVGVRGGEKFDKWVVVLGGIGFLLLLIATTFLKVAADVAGEILNGESGGGVGGNQEGFLLEVAGVEATPGYHAIRIGAAGLVLVGLVVTGTMWGLSRDGGIPTEKRDGVKGGLVGLLVGAVRGKREDSGANGPEWKGRIGNPIPLHTTSAHTHTHTHAGQPPYPMSYV